MAETISGSGGNVDAVQEIDFLVGIGNRHAGSDGERRAARHLERRLQELGREAIVEPARVRPSFALTHLIHAVAGIVGSVLAVYAPLPGLLLLTLVTVSAFGDLTGTFHLARLLTSARASQNVISDEDTGKPGLLILVAHCDAPRGGALDDRRLRRWPAVFFWSLAIIEVCALARLAGIEATWLTVIQFIPTVVLIASIPLFADAAAASPLTGANDNASGAATVLRLAERYGGTLEHFDVMVLFTGASAHFALGMRSWLKRHRRELEPSEVAVVVVDAVGCGTPVYAVKEGPVFTSRMHPSLVELCRENEAGAAFTSRELSDAYAARAAGLPSIRIAAQPDKGADADAADPDAVARAYDYVSELIERIDSELGPQLA